MGNMILGNNTTQFKVGSGDCTIYLGTTLVYSPTPPTPTFDGKWLATYTTGTSSAECDSTSAITSGEITLMSLVGVEIGDCVTSIGNNAFQYCFSLKSIDIPNSVTSIGDNSFFGCGSLSSITIPNSVTSIGQSAFNNCTNLTSVTIYATIPPQLGMNAFQSTPIVYGNGWIYVPAASVDVYKSASGWSTYASRIQAIPNS